MATTGNPLLDNPATKAALIASMQAPPPPQGAIMPPAGASQPPQLTGLRQPAPQEPQGAISMPQGPMPSMPSTPSPQVKAPRGTSTGDEAELSRKLSTRSGISQIAGKVEGSRLGQAHPMLGKILGIGAQGLAQLGDIGLRTLAPAVDIATPGTSLHHMADVRGDQRQVAEDVANEGKQAQTAAIPSETAQREEMTREMPEKTASEEALQGAQTREANAKVDQGPDLAAAYAHRVNQVLKDGGDPSTDPTVMQLQDAITAIQKQPLPKGKEHVDLQGAGGKSMGGTFDPATGKYYDSIGREIANPQLFEKPNQAGMVTMIVPDPNNPGGGIVQRLGAGSRVAPGAQTTAGVNTMNTPTTNQRTAAGRAETVLAMVPEVEARIDSLAPKLGPVQGRWNEFMQGKLGNDDPDFAALRSDLLMMSSAVALAHAQGRLPENLREEFDRAINAPKQTPQNLKATIQAMVPWLEQVQNQGGRPGQVVPSSNTEGGPPAGADVKVPGKDGKMYWGNSKTKQILGPA